MRCTEITKYPTKLIGIDKNVIYIPELIVTNPNKKILATYIYCYVRAGLDDVAYFSIGSLVRYFNYKTNNRKVKTHDMFIESIKYLVNNNFIISNIDFNSLKLNTIMSITINRKKSKSENDLKYFSRLYVDELLDILDYCKVSSINVINMLSVFVFFRYKILLRHNSSDMAEARYFYYKQISKETNIGMRTLYKIIKALYTDLNLIYVAHVKYKFDNEKWITLPSIFCNYYRRKTGEVLDGGEQYYKTEADKCYKQLISNFNPYIAKSNKYNTTYEDEDTDFNWYTVE